MHLLSEKKRKVEQEEAETNMEILLEFLTRSRQQKQEELNQVRRMQIDGNHKGFCVMHTWWICLLTT